MSVLISFSIESTKAYQTRISGKDLIWARPEYITYDGNSVEFWEKGLPPKEVLYELGRKLEAVMLSL